MNIIKKDATITATGTDEDFPGTFEVILSAPTLDRDGETLYPEEWKLPLPDKINFDTDHGMSVATTVGSGVPSILEDGRMKVAGTYSSLQHAQDLRTLVKEGHIDRTSVAFTSSRSTKDGKTTVKRELLNGAFVSIPSNREAVVLSSKSTKAGARNSVTDMDMIQQIHDLALKLGASSTIPESDLTKAATGRVSTKAVQGSLEEKQERCSDALTDAYGTGAYVWLIGTLPDTLVFQISQPDSSDSDTYQQSYTDDGSVVTLTGDRTAVDLTQIVKPDPDDAADSGADGTPAAGTPAAGAKSAPVEEADSPTDEDLAAKALQIIAGQFS